MFEPSLQKSGSVAFYDGEDAIKKIKHIYFKGAFLISYRESFSRLSSKPTLIDLVISAGVVKIQEAEFRFPWFKGSLETEIEHMIETVIEYLPVAIRPKAHTPTSRASAESPKSATPTTIDKKVDVLKQASPEALSIHVRLDKAGVKSIEENGEIKYLTLKGEKFCKIDNSGEFIVVTEKGKRPSPEEYKNQKTLDNHQEKFKKEGASFIAVKSWTEGGNPDNKNLPPRKFVGLKSEMDVVMQKYKDSGNDWKVLRHELNLGATTDLSKDEIYYINIDGNDPNYSFETPNGNEAGAIKNEWVPCGHTKNGTIEAALVGSDKVNYNKSIDNLVNCFGKEKCTKIK